MIGKSKKNNIKSPSELRLDLVSNDWVIIATGRAKRPESFAKNERIKTAVATEDCPFCQPENISEVLAQKNKADGSRFAIVIPNKFPALSAGGVLEERKEGPHRIMTGFGYHEVLITAPHERSMAELTIGEVKLVIDLYQERYLNLMARDSIKYVSVFHNHGKEAGASVAHSHSQIIAIPVLDPNLRNSLEGAETFFRSHGECVYCVMLEWDLKDQKRIVYENEKFVAVCPFAPQVSFEVRIYPKKHAAYFGAMDDNEQMFFAEVLQKALSKIHKGLADPAYNFYIHTAPARDKSYGNYHWHLNILPKTATWAGFELGAGIEISTIKPEDAAEFLRKQ